MFLNSSDIGKEFGVDLIVSDAMNDALKQWEYISTSKPPWQNTEDDIESVNVAKLVSDTRAKLTTLDIGVEVSGSPRADFLQEKIVNELLKKLPDQIAEADRLGGIMFKWNGKTWDFILPGSFGITAKDDNSKITGAIFASQATQGKAHYTRLEYHRFEGTGEDGKQIYRVTNKAFKNQLNSSNKLLLGTPVPLNTIDEWAHLQPEVYIKDLDYPLFSYYRVPGSNTVDPSSPLGLAVFANAVTEIKAVDIGISRMRTEVADSKHVTFVGQQVIQNAINRGTTLPRFVRGLGLGLNDGDTTAVHEHVPTIQTEARIKGINFDLSLLGVKCGFSAGVFVLDGQTGLVTATQVESDDRDTIQTIKTDRDALKDALEQAIYGANALVTLYGLAPLGEYEINFNFGDITYNYEEDRAAWRGYVMQGWMPKWLYFVKFEGMSEEEAKKMTAEAQAAELEPGLFDNPPHKKDAKKE